MKKSKQKKLNDFPHLLKITDSIFRVAGNLDNVNDLTPLISESSQRDWHCLLCLNPTKERAWSIPESNPMGNYNGTLIYAVCEKHERNSTTEELIKLNVRARIVEVMKSQQVQLIKKEKENECGNIGD